MSKKLYKILSRNDVGVTKSHQSGITIPKDVVAKGILPELSRDILNPRETICFRDENNLCWEFQYIYYNDIYHGKPRNQGHDEYRLTRVKGFIRQYDIKCGDEIWFSRENDGLHIGFVKQQKVEWEDISDAAETEQKFGGDEVVIILGSSWKCVETKI